MYLQSSFGFTLKLHCIDVTIKGQRSNNNERGEFIFLYDVLQLKIPYADKLTHYLLYYNIYVVRILTSKLIYYLVLFDVIIII